MNKEVRYDIYCKSCEFFTCSASNDPCNECLGRPSNQDSKVPVNFKQAKAFINYLLPDTNLIHPGYTRDHLVSMNWFDSVPTEADLKKYFELRDGDWWEKDDYIKNLKEFEEENNENS